MSAPERIWAWFFTENKRDDVMQGGWDDKPDVRETEYIRADLATSEADALRAENKRLREAGDDVVRSTDTMMLMLAGDLAMTKPSIETAIRRALDTRNAWDNAKGDTHER